MEKVKNRYCLRDINNLTVFIGTKEEAFDATVELLTGIEEIYEEYRRYEEQETELVPPLAFTQWIAKCLENGLFSEYYTLISEDYYD